MGLSIDRYGDICLYQTWQDLVSQEVCEQLTLQISKCLGVSLKTVWNHRKKRGSVVHKGDRFSEPHFVQELGLKYTAQPQHEGIDPLLFLDFRAGRRWVRGNVKGLSVLNLFSYTCGIGVAAMAGEALSVHNVDFAQRALDYGRLNAQLNGIPLKRFHTIHDNVFPVVRQFAGLKIQGRAARKGFKRYEKNTFDLVVLDPPRLSKSPFGKVDLVRDYQSLFKPALLCTKEGGTLLITNNVASVDEQDWHKIILKCAQKSGRKVHSLEPLRPEDDFPSPDRRWPLKMAIVRV